MKLQDDRLIVILGMAHSGTTVFTHTLLQCPSIICFACGTESWVFENKYLLPQFASVFEQKDNPVSKFVGDHPNKFVILKRPWQEARPEFFKKHMPNAHYFLLIRSFDALVKSWAKPNSSVMVNLRLASPKVKRVHYDKYLEAANTFAVKVESKKVLLINYEEMCRDPSKIFADVAIALGINFTFDTSDVGDLNKNIKEMQRGKKPSRKK